MALPTDAAARKNVPIYSGVLKYFPDAIAYVAQISKAGNDQHNPGQPLHWSREKSGDHHDCISRHLIESGTIDPLDGLRHTGKLAWRALAVLQLELEAAAKPLVPSDNPVDVKEQDAIRKAAQEEKQAQCKHCSPFVRDGNRFCSVCLVSLPIEDVEVRYTKSQRCDSKTDWYTCSLKDGHTGRHEAYLDHDRTSKIVREW